MLKKTLKSLPYIRRLHGEIGALKTELTRWHAWQKPGHFYSPIPSLEEVRADAHRIFNKQITDIPGLALGEDRQLSLLRALAAYQKDLLLAWQTPGTARYHFENEYYSWADGIVLFGMLMHARPRRLVEVGSGFSSALVLDTNQAFFDGSMECTFIDPYPQRLLSLIDTQSLPHTRILSERVQQVPLSVFKALGPNDVLLIDSSHVSKTGSDVNWLLFEIVPRLQPGVWIHFHDIFSPFEYPQGWVTAGVAWNECYLLRAFLQYNSAFQIEFFTSYLLQHHESEVRRYLPLALNSEREDPRITDAPGSSLWLRKID